MLTALTCLHHPTFYFFSSKQPVAREDVELGDSEIRKMDESQLVAIVGLQNEILAQLIVQQSRRAAREEELRDVESDVRFLRWKHEHLLRNIEAMEALISQQSMHPAAYNTTAESVPPLLPSTGENTAVSDCCC